MRIYALLRILYLALFPWIGIFVAFNGFCDPDTCWHLALGKWFVEHGCLPTIDPFSTNVGHYAFVAPGLPLIQHEWLADLIFYLNYHSFGLQGLLVATSLVLSLAMVVVPTLIMVKGKVDERRSLMTVILLVVASLFRFWVRPEQFSYLLFGLLILVSSLQVAVKKRELLLRAVLIALIMAVWANTHMLFAIGLLYVIANEALRFYWDSDAVSHKEEAVQTVALNSASAVIGTLFTPWGIWLLPYVIRSLSAPVETLIKENGPLTLTSAFSLSGFGLLAFLILFWYQALSKPTFSNTTRRSSALALSAAATLVPFKFHRLTAFALIILTRTIPLLKRAAEDNEETFEDANEFDWRVQALGVASAMIVCFLGSTFLVTAQIPADSHLFHPPYQAVEYLKTHEPAGRMLNDLKFGDMMCWTLDHPPDLFIDGRIPIYNREIPVDYMRMMDCKDDWRNLLVKYRIDWVFFAPKAPLVQELLHDHSWKSTYQDERAVILTRVKQP